VFEVKKLDASTVFYQYSRKYKENLCLLGFCTQPNNMFPYLINLNTDNLNSIKEIGLPNGAHQFNLGAIFNQDSITVFSYVNESINNTTNQININYLNSNYELKSKIITPFKKYGWDYVKAIERQVNKNNLFILVGNNDMPNIYTDILVELNAKGNVVKETYLDTKNTCCKQIYYINDNYVYVLYENIEMGKFIVETFKI
jgi:hypothetical protein